MAAESSAAFFHTLLPRRKRTYAKRLTILHDNTRRPVSLSAKIIDVKKQFPNVREKLHSQRTDRSSRSPLEDTMVRFLQFNSILELCAWVMTDENASAKACMIVS